jgi:hypothetical protein
LAVIVRTAAMCALSFARSGDSAAAAGAATTTAAATKARAKFVVNVMLQISWDFAAKRGVHPLNAD